MHSPCQDRTKGHIGQSEWELIWYGVQKSISLSRRRRPKPESAHIALAQKESAMSRKRYPRELINYSEQVELKEKIGAAFAELRADGFLAKQNYLCCSSCAGYAMAERASQLADRGRRVAGVVFYHRQDAAATETDGGGYIAYRSATTQKARGG